MLYSRVVLLASKAFAALEKDSGKSPTLETASILQWLAGCRSGGCMQDGR
jgi:hypothetical protein